jgi:hypothetical protein
VTFPPTLAEFDPSHYPPPPMLGLGCSAGIACWLVLAPIAVDLAHPLFVHCDGPADSAGDHAHAMSGSSHGWAPGRTARPAAQIPGCCGDRQQGPSHLPVACCVHGGCLCCGGLAIATPPPHVLPPGIAVRPALPPDPAPGGGERDVLFRPPKA